MGDLDEIRRRLRERIRDLAEVLLGKPNRAMSTRSNWRWGGKGSISIQVSGKDRGACVCFEDGWKGDPIGLIQREHRCDFKQAIAWAAGWLGIDTNYKPDTAADERRQKEREEQRARDAEEDAANQARRIRIAQKLWKRRISDPIDSLGEQYLTVTRRIPIKPADWPKTVGVLPPGRHHWSEAGTDGREVWREIAYAAALILAATNAAGAITATQRICLDADAKPLLFPNTTKKLKITNGSLDGSAVRLPGPAAGPLILAEGPETGMSVWAATGHETWIALGSISNLVPPRDRRIVVARDDDKAHSPADKMLSRLITQWRHDRINAAVASPWIERRGDGSDFNDVIKADGPGAVRTRIHVALNPPTPFTSAARGTPDEARQILKETIKTFYIAGAATHDPTSDAAPMTWAIRTEVGSGKSAEARYGAVIALAKLIADSVSRCIIFAVPSHSLSDEAVAKFNAMPGARAAGLIGAVWRGREARRPGSNDPKDRMCADPQRVKDAMKARESIQEAVCRNKRGKCPLFDTCAYQAQSRRSDSPNVWFIAHELLFHEKPAAIGEVAAVIVDESMFEAGLETDTKLSLDTFETEVSLPGLDGQRFDYLRAVARDVLKVAPDGPIAHAAMADAALTTEAAGEAYALVWRGKVDSGMHPAMSAAERNEAITKAAINATVSRMAMFWKAMQEVLKHGGPTASGWASLGWINTKEGPVRVIKLKGRRNIRAGWIAPTLLLDATLDIDLVRPYWPNVTLAADIGIEAPHQRIFQVADRSYSKAYFNLSDGEPDPDDPPLTPKEQSKLDERRAAGSRHLRRLHATISTVSRLCAPKRSLAVVQMAVEAALPTFGKLPQTLDLAHHNDIAGRDEWKDVGALIVVGRCAPSPRAVEDLAEALTGRAVNPIPGWYQKTAAARLLDNNDTVSAERDFHPDPIAESIRWQACEGQIVQIIGRARGINRTAADPVNVIVMTDVILPMPVARLLTATDLDPTSTERMLAAGGVAFESAAHACRAYPQIWPDRECAQKAFSRAEARPSRKRTDRRGEGHSPIESVLIRECPSPFHRLVYKTKGPGQKDVGAWFDPSMTPNPAAIVTALLRVALAGWMIVSDDDHAGDPATLYPRAGANGQRVMVTPTDLLTIRTPNGSIRVRRFDGSVTTPEPMVTQTTH
jgi:putative DNA primase/helicase